MDYTHTTARPNKTSCQNYVALQMTGLTNPDKVVKILFLIHNSYRHVQDQLLKDSTKDSTLSVYNLEDKVSYHSVREVSPKDAQ